MFAVVDSMYNFLYINVGSQGRLSDAGVFAQTSFIQALHDGTLNLPSSHSLPGRDIATPYTSLWVMTLSPYHSIL